ncbi:MAG: GNAT family N-acetyltransferase [Chloroflexales bacterium]|nr:GNAT family N-acetyltransferase [Chloroflexales bacterium]
MTVHDPRLLPIRPAVPDDAPQLATLRYRFRSELAPPSESEAAFIARALPWLVEHLAHPSWRVWVAVAPDGQIVGQVFLQLIAKVPNPVEEAEHLGYLTNLFVLPAYRSRGLGRRLLDTAIAACPPERVDRLILWPSPRSRTLYERAGFQTPASILERLLERRSE